MRFRCGGESVKSLCYFVVVAWFTLDLEKEGIRTWIGFHENKTLRPCWFFNFSNHWQGLVLRLFHKTDFDCQFVVLLTSTFWDIPSQLLNSCVFWLHEFMPEEILWCTWLGWTTRRSGSDRFCRIWEERNLMRGPHRRRVQLWLCPGRKAFHSGNGGNIETKRSSLILVMNTLQRLRWI